MVKTAVVKAARSLVPVRLALVYPVHMPVCTRPKEEEEEEEEVAIPCSIVRLENPA